MLKLKTDDDNIVDQKNVLVDDQMQEENYMNDEDDDQNVQLGDDISDEDDLMIDAEMFEDYNHSNEFF